MNLSTATKLWLAWRSSKQISATLASKTTMGQAGVTATLGAVLAFAVALYNAQFPASALSAEAAAGLIGVILTVLGPILSRYVALVRDPAKVLPDPGARCVRVRRSGQSSWEFRETTALDAQSEGYAQAVVKRADGDGDIMDLSTGIVVGMIRLPKPGPVGEQTIIGKAVDLLRDAEDRRN